MKAGGLKRQLEQFGTLFGLKLSHLVFTLTEQLSCTLQAKNTTVQAAISAAYRTESWLKWQRTDEKFDSFYADVLSTSAGWTEAPILPRKCRMPQRLGDGAAPHQFTTAKDQCRATSFGVIDTVAGELNR